MKGVDTIARVRREHFVRGKTIKEIVRDLHVSRNTVRKVLRTGATAFVYDRRDQPQPKLGPFVVELERLLTANENKAKRERLTLIQLFEQLQAAGYAGEAAPGGRPGAAREAADATGRRIQAQEHPLAARVHKLFLPACDGGGVQRIAKKDAAGARAAAA